MVFKKTDMVSPSKIRLSMFFLFLVLLGISCIEEYSFESQDPGRLLTVEGRITTQLKKHRIRLSRASQYGPDFNGLNRPESLAAVLIRDDLGKTISLEEISPGVYETADFVSAEIGRSYNLEIITFTGRRYISLPETIVPVPQIDSLSYRSIRSATTNRLLSDVGVQVIAHFRDPGDVKNYYYWAGNESTYVLLTQPEDYTLPITHPTCPRCPSPKPCCSLCFRKEQPVVNIYASDDNEFNGLAQSRIIAYIPDDGLRFLDTYRYEGSNLSINERGHRFLKLVDQQINLTGSVFDPPPANIRGNIISLDDSNETVLGYFFASDEQPIQAYIKNENLEFVLSPPTKIPDDCRLSRNASLQPPADWNPED
jgi:hypothetical protein